MNIHHVLLFCFISAASSGLSGAQVVSVKGTEGRGLTVRCHFSLLATKKFFCKGDCKKDNILIETSESKAQKGRYTIESLGTVQSPVLFVTIKPLTKSDTGFYQCGTRGLLTQESQMVHLTVTAAPTASSPSSTPPVTVGQATRQPAEYYLSVCVPVLLLLLAAVLLFLYKEKTRRNVDGLSTRVSLDDRNMKVELYENGAFHAREDGIYESLDPVSRDQDQTYCTLSHTQHK